MTNSLSGSAVRLCASAGDAWLKAEASFRTQKSNPNDEFIQRFRGPALRLCGRCLVEGGSGGFKAKERKQASARNTPHTARLSHTLPFHRYPRSLLRRLLTPAHSRVNV
ncbi:MAG: hypothetical protein ACYC6L_09745 [Anaerolineae bacterium]